MKDTEERIAYIREEYEDEIKNGEMADIISDLDALATEADRKVKDTSGKLAGLIAELRTLPHGIGEV